LTRARTGPTHGARYLLHTPPEIGHWSKTFIGWVAYHKSIPLIRHDVMSWEPIADQAAARAVPLEKVRQAGATTVVLGMMKVARRPAPPAGHRVRKPVVVGR